MSLKETLIYGNALSSSVDDSGTCWKGPAGCGGDMLPLLTLKSCIPPWPSDFSPKRDGDALEDCLDTALPGANSWRSINASRVIGAAAVTAPRRWLRGASPTAEKATAQNQVFPACVRANVCKGDLKRKKEGGRGGGTSATLRMLLLKVYLASSIWIIVENRILPGTQLTPLQVKPDALS